MASCSVSCPGKFHGQQCLEVMVHGTWRVGQRLSNWAHVAAYGTFRVSWVVLVVKSLPDAGDIRDTVVSIPRWGKFPGSRNGNLLQYPCLENVIDRGAVGYSPWGHKVSDMTEHKQKVDQPETTQKANTITINPESASQNSSPGSLICCSAPVPISKKLHCFVNISHFRVLVKKALNYGRCPTASNSEDIKLGPNAPE